MRISVPARMPTTIFLVFRANWAAPWGKPAMGYRTRVSKTTGRLIVRSRQTVKNFSCCLCPFSSTEKSLGSNPLMGRPLLSFTLTGSSTRLTLVEILYRTVRPGHLLDRCLVDLVHRERSHRPHQLAGQGVDDLAVGPDEHGVATVLIGLGHTPVFPLAPADDDP